jgi:hypothetical protein
MAELENEIEHEATSKEVDVICKALRDAEPYGLQSEVIWSALKAMKNDSNISIAQAIEEGLDEWDVPDLDYTNHLKQGG